MRDIESPGDAPRGDAAQEDDLYVGCAENAGLAWTGRSIWASCGASRLTQGWKLHISIVPADAVQLFDRIFPVLKREAVPFKFIRTPAQLRGLNEGTFGETQIGKAVTVYPDSDAQSLELARRLVPLTAGLRGPDVITDMALGGTVYARYGSYNPIMSRNRLGQMIQQIRFPDGTLRVDRYQAPYEVPEGLTHPFGEILAEHRMPAGEDDSKLLGPGYLPLNVLRISAKGSIYFAIDLRARDSVRYCVLKEGRKHTSSDDDGRDMRSRLQHQGKLQALINDIGVAPSVDAYFESPQGHGYLPMAFVDGHDLENTFGEYPYSAWPTAEKKKRLRTFLRLFEAVRMLHERGIIHRDLTPRNVRLAANGSIRLLDFELAWQVGMHGAPFSQGTPGFVSPQQIRNETPGTADDVFSLGSLLIWSLGNIDPQYLVVRDHGQLEERLLSLIGASQDLCRLIARCWADHGTDRPSIADLAQGLTNELNVLDGGAGRRPGDRAAAPSEDTIRRGLQGLMSATPASRQNGLWLSYLDQKPQRDGRPHHQTGGQMGLLRSLYRGVAGTVYVYAKFARPGRSSPERNEQAVRAIDWLLQHDGTQDDQLPGLYFGEAGVALAICHAVGAGIVSGGSWFADYLDEALRGPLDWPDLTHGAAGQGLAALACAEVTGPIIAFQAIAERAAHFLMEVQSEDGGWTIPDGVPGMSGQAYTGFAHGVAGILYFLIRLDQRHPDDEVRDSWQRGLDWLDRMAIETDMPAGTWPVHTESEDRWFRWCHGAPGIALTYLAAFEATGDGIYAEKARTALGHFEYDLRLTNYSTCCGLTGIGEIYLTAWQTLGEHVYLSRARRLGETLSALAVPIDENALVWKVDDSSMATSDLMCGSGGVVHFLSRLHDKSSAAAFPGLG